MKCFELELPERFYVPNTSAVEHLSQTGFSESQSEEESWRPGTSVPRLVSDSLANRFKGKWVLFVNHLKSEVVT